MRDYVVLAAGLIQTPRGATYVKENPLYWDARTDRKRFPEYPLVVLPCKLPVGRNNSVMKHRASSAPHGQIYRKIFSLGSQAARTGL